MNLTILDSLHQVTLSFSTFGWHSNHFLSWGLALIAYFPDMFWYQWTINAYVKKQDQVKLSSGWTYPRCPHILIMLIPVQQLIRVWLTTSAPGGLHHFLQWNLPVFSLVSCMKRLLLGTSEPVACKIEFAPGANITPTWLVSLQLISSHPQTEIDTVLLLEGFPTYWKTWTLFAANYIFMSNHDVAGWVRDSKVLGWFGVKLWVTTVALGLM